MNKAECGELVYVPSQTTLFRLDTNLNVEAYRKLAKPLNLLVIEKDAAGLLGVYYEGKKWFLQEREVY